MSAHHQAGLLLDAQFRAEGIARQLRGLAECLLLQGGTIKADDVGELRARLQRVDGILREVLP